MGGGGDEVIWSERAWAKNSLLGGGGGGSFPSIFDRRCDPPALRARDGKGGKRFAVVSFTCDL
eukprot:scaffold6230_cov151-Skeletonema_menzelii.AAC.9